MSESRARRGALGACIFSSALLAGGCAGSSVLRHQEASSAQTTEYSTFRLNEPTVGQTDPELARLLLEGLEEKGYRQVGAEAELVVTYKLLVGTVNDDGAGSPDEPAIVHDDMFSRGTTAEESHNKILLVIIQDARTLDTLWVGWSQADLAEDEIETRARDALVELMDRIPDRPRSS